MVLSWLRRFRRGEPAGDDDPAAWRAAVDGLPFFAALEDGEQERLLELAHAFEDDVSWEGCGGLELNETMRASISIQACLLILNLSPRCYRRVRTILVYPSAYVGADKRAPRAGETSLRGPVVLAWDEARAGGRRPHDGRNTVLHELAHKLDLLDDQADGVPPVESGEQYRTWMRVTGAEFETLRRHARGGKATLLDAYGATNPAEFFAVATECFFEQPRAMRSRHRELYGLLSALYAQDPAARSAEARDVGRRRGRF